MLVFKLAIKNLLGAGLRTWLNVFVLSMVFILIIWMQGFIEGMSRDMMNAMIQAELGGGQYWHSSYDPFDPFTLEKSHAPLSADLELLEEKGVATPILVTSGAIYPDGRVQSVLLKGIDPGQQVLDIPSSYLVEGEDGYIPALIGSQMASSTKLKIGDYVTVRWRDVNGTFDADDIRIVQIMKTSVPSIDRGQIWLPIEDLREMLLAPGEATIVVTAQGSSGLPPGDESWIWRDLDFLLRDARDLIKSKSAGTSVIYIILLFMGLLAIFDTQVLAVWRRRKEIGTLMALGMDRIRVIWLFTLEGALHAVLALFIGAIYGIPLLYWFMKEGLPMPSIAQDMGVALPEKLYPYYGMYLVAGTTVLILVTVTVVSFMPASKIAKLKPTDALRGKGR